MWKRKLGVLAAASPAYGNGRVFVTILSRGKKKPGAVYALDAKTGKILWKRLLPSRSESSPVFDNDRIYFGSENGTVYSIRAGDGAVRWKFKASGAVKSGLALANGKLFFGDYSGRVYAIRQADGGQVVEHRHQGRRRSACAPGSFYSTPAVAYGRVYIGNTDGKMYSFASSNGKLAWTKGTGSYVYSSPAVAQLPGMQADGLLRLLRRQVLRASTPATARSRWTHRDGGKISGGATVVGDIVYFSNYGKKDTTGLGVRTGREVFHMGRGAFNPVDLRRAHDLPDGLLERCTRSGPHRQIGKPADRGFLTSGMRVACRSGRSRRPGRRPRPPGGLRSGAAGRRRRLRRSPGRRRRSQIARVSVSS